MLRLSAVVAITISFALTAPASTFAAYGLLSSQTGIGGAPLDVDSANRIVAMNPPPGAGPPYGVRIYDATGNLVGGFGDNGSAPPEPWVSALDLAVDPDDNIWIADTYHDQILKFNPAGDLLMELGDSGTGIGQFRRPLGIASDSAGNFYVADSLNDRIQKFAPDGSALAHWGTYGSDPGEFAHPTGIDVGPDGSVFVTDRYNGRIEQFTSAGDLVRIFGQHPPDSGDPSAPLPRPIAVGDDGSVFTRALGAYSDYNDLARFSPTGELAETFGCPAIGNGGLAARGEILYVGFQGMPGDIHNPPTPPRLGKYGEGGTSWTATCPKPTVSLRGPHRQRASNLRVKISCPFEACTAVVRGLLQRRSESTKSKTKISIEEKTLSLEKGDVRRIHLRSENPHRLVRLADKPQAERRRWRAEVDAFAQLNDRTASDSFSIAIK